MTLGLAFWILMLLWLVLGCGTHGQTITWSAAICCFSSFYCFWVGKLWCSNPQDDQETVRRSLRRHISQLALFVGRRPARLRQISRQPRPDGSALHGRTARGQRCRLTVGSETRSALWTSA